MLPNHEVVLKAVHEMELAEAEVKNKNDEVYTEMGSNLEAQIAK